MLSHTHVWYVFLMDVPGPSPLQIRILRHLRKAEEEGRAPTYRELALAFGWRSVATARDHLAALRARGLVSREPRKARSLRLTAQGRASANREAQPSMPPAALSETAQQIMDLLAPWLQPRSYPRGALLWQEHDPAERLVIVDAGRLRAFRQLADGRTATVLQFGAGDVIGFAPFFDGGGYPASVEALEAVRIRFVVREDVIRAMREPRVAMALIGSLAGRLRQAFDTIEQLSLHRALPRVAAALLPLSKGGDFTFITLPHASRVFAEALGLAPATLSRTLAQFVGMGILHRLGPRRYQLLLPQELARIAQGEENNLR